MELPCLRKLRLLFEDFPKNHNLILLAQPALMSMLSLSINEDIRSRVTYSVILKPMNPDQTRDFILDQLDRCGLGHNAFSEQALNLIVRSAEGRLRRARNLSVASLLEAVRDQTRTVDIKQVNRVLIQPHWRHPATLQHIIPIITCIRSFSKSAYTFIHMTMSAFTTAITSCCSTPSHGPLSGCASAV